MRIDELKADEFFEAVALAAEGIQAIMDSESGKELGERFAGFKGSLADVAEDEREQAAGIAILKAVVASLPALLRENGDAVYGILAACDGVSLDEYKESFTPAKMMDDIKSIVEWASANVETVSAFLAS
jgi:hypothetical protein